ncbi:hypothetical protein ACO1O0_008006 [Amphichorda felina]
MTESSAQPSSTPNRRRQGRNGARAAAQKGYVSENDVGGVDASRYNNTTLQTPEKRSAGSPAANNVRVGSGRHRIKNKADKQKNAGSSPEFDRPAQSTTPQRPASVKAPNSIAFAGATFHASPAPSALPMPSFFKITGASPGSKDPQRTAQQPSPPWGTYSSEDPTEALKRALFKDLNRSPSALSPPVPSSRNGISESPSAPRGHEVSRNAYQGSNFQAMENDLRRILKLDDNPSTSSPEHHLFTK